MDRAHNIPSDFRLAPSRNYAYGGIARNVAFYFIALIFVPFAAALTLWLLPVAMALLGLAMYRLTMVMHDCVHGTLFVSGKANRVWGVAVGAMSGIEFHTFTRLHWTHHRIVGQPDDPQGPDYLLLPRSRFGVAWHLLRPLTGYNLFKLWQVARVLEQSPSDRRRTGIWLAPVILVQICAAFIASGGLAAWWLAPLPILSAATFGLFFAQLRGFAEHVAMPGHAAENCVRSHRATLVDKLLLCDMNFNLHREHHLHPQVPSVHLPALHGRLVAEQPAAFALTPGMFGTIWARLQAADTDRNGTR